MHYIWIAHLARERTRDLERAAARHHLWTGQSGPVATARPGRTLELVARPLWVLGRASRSVADAATAAAMLLEGRSA